jgi:hypothetical protein
LEASYFSQFVGPEGENEWHVSRPPVRLQPGETKDLIWDGSNETWRDWDAKRTDGAINIAFGIEFRLAESSEVPTYTGSIHVDEVIITTNTEPARSRDNYERYVPPQGPKETKQPATPVPMTITPSPMPTPTPKPMATAAPTVTWDIQGATLAAYWHDSYAQPDAKDQVDYMKDLGVDTVAVIVQWFQDDMESAEIYPLYDTETPTDESVREIIGYILEQDMDVMLKPHVEPRVDWQGSPRGWRGVIRPRDPNAWFDSYREFIMHYADMAREINATHGEYKVTHFCLGTEMASMTQGEERHAFWENMKTSVEKDAGFSGKILYSAHEYEVLGGEYRVPVDESQPALYEQVFDPLPDDFWDKFDCAGMTVYYDIYDPDDPTLRTAAPSTDALVSGWTHNLARRPERVCLVQRLTERMEGKNVIFSEIGYRSIAHAAYHPFAAVPEQPNRPDLSSAYDAEAQRNAYEAAFRVWGDTSWLKGAFWWQFVPRAVNQRECGTDVPPDAVVSYTPCNRPAAEVLKVWYDGVEDPRVPPTYTPQLPDLLGIGTILCGAEALPVDRAWRAQGSDDVTFSIDDDVLFDGKPTMHMSNTTPCLGSNADQRYAQLDFMFSSPVDFSSYAALSVMAKTGDSHDEAELSVVLIDKDGVEWQSTRFFGGDAWRDFTMNLEQGSDEPADPWDHPADFVVPFWAKETSAITTTEELTPAVHIPQGGCCLDLTQIAGIRLKAMRICEDKCAPPAPQNQVFEVQNDEIVNIVPCTDTVPSPDPNEPLEAWFGDVRLMPEPGPDLALPVVDSFTGYDDDADLQRYWRAVNSPNGEVKIDVTREQGLRVSTRLPCGYPDSDLTARPMDANPCRYMLVSRRFSQPADFSGYRELVVNIGHYSIDASIEAKARGAARDTYVGGEFSLLLWDASGECDETWQYSRWLDDETDNLTIAVPLVGNGQGDQWHDPREGPPQGFLVRTWERVDDAVLDLTSIAGVGLRTNTVNSVCDLAEQSELTIDSIVLR